MPIKETEVGILRPMLSTPRHPSLMGSDSPPGTLNLAHLPEAPSSLSRLLPLLSLLDWAEGNHMVVWTQQGMLPVAYYLRSATEPQSPRTSSTPPVLHPQEGNTG